MNGDPESLDNARREAQQRRARFREAMVNYARGLDGSEAALQSFDDQEEGASAVIWRAIVELSRGSRDFTADDVWGIANSDGVDRTNKGLAALFNYARWCGLIHPTGRTTHARRKDKEHNHNQRLAVWAPGPAPVGAKLAPPPAAVSEAEKIINSLRDELKTALAEVTRLQNIVDAFRRPQGELFPA